MPRDIAHDARKVGSRNVQTVSIETDVVLFAVVMHQQTLEVAENLSRTVGKTRRLTVLLIQGIGHLQQKKATQMADYTITIKVKLLQSAGKKHQRLLQIIGLLRFQLENRQQIITHELGYLSIDKLSDGKRVEIIGLNIKADHTEIDTHISECDTNTRCDNQQMEGSKRITGMDIRHRRRSVCDEQEIKTLVQQNLSVSSTGHIHSKATRHAYTRLTGLHQFGNCNAHILP